MSVSKRDQLPLPLQFVRIHPRRLLELVQVLILAVLRTVIDNRPGLFLIDCYKDQEKQRSHVYLKS